MSRGGGRELQQDGQHVQTRCLDHTEPHKITWTDFWKAQPLGVKFLIQSVYAVLPSPVNLHCWSLANTLNYAHCARREVPWTSSLVTAQSHWGRLIPLVS